MAVRRRPLSATRLAGAGAAGVIGAATVLGFGPAAHADAGKAKPQATPAPSGTDSAKSAGKTATPAPRVQPTYGVQKYRVGVQIKDGSWVPAGTATGNTTLTITETGPNAPAPPDNTFQCTTTPGSEEGNTTTWCPRPEQQLARLAARYPGIAPRWHHKPTPADAPSDEEFTAEARDTVTITQTTVRPNLVIDTATAVLKPCHANAEFPIVGPACANDPTSGEFVAKSTDEIFDDPGLPPAAADDSAQTGYRQPVVVDELSNDNTKGAPASVKITSGPGHGSAQVLSDKKIRYQPAAGFSGTDKFQYTLSTANGSATATVTVTVAAPPPSAKDDSASTTRDQAVDIDATANDNPRGQDITKLDVASTPQHGTAHVVHTAHGREIRYTPDSGYLGKDSFRYSFTTDGGTASATVHVDVTPPPPVAVDDSASVHSGDSVTVAVTQNDDANGGGQLTITSTSTPGHGSVQISGQTVVYTADASYTGPDSFTYTIENAGGSDTATVHITVSSSGVLADTGMNSAALLQIAGALLVLGATSTAAGRRRRGRHAGA